MNTLTPSERIINGYVERLAGRTSFAIDSFICDRMETEDPFAAWIFSKKFFRNRFFARLLRLLIEERTVDRGREITVFCRGRKIGTLLIVTRAMIKTS